jgi:hypothetical protein
MNGRSYDKTDTVHSAINNGYTYVVIYDDKGLYPGLCITGCKDELRNMI